MVKRFLKSERSGFYVAVLQEGDVSAGDAMTPLRQHPAQVSVLEVNRLYVAKTFRRDDVAVAERALTVDAFPEVWKAYFRDRL